MTSLTASQKSNLSIAEALSVGTAPALGLGRVVSWHSLVAQITKRGATVSLPAFFPSHASQPAWSALSIWVDCIYLPDHCCNGYCWARIWTQRFISVSQPRAFRRFSYSQPLFFGVPSELPHLSSERLWLLEVHFRRSHNVFGTGFSAWDIPLEHLHHWSQPSNPTATSAQRVALSLALQTQSQN